MYSYAIVGTGALGGFYGGRLQRAGCDVHFLLHADYDHVRKHGLVIDDCEGNFRLPKVNAYSTPQELPRCAVAVVALKTTHNHLLPGILPEVLAPNGFALVLQNGLGNEDTCAAIVGAQHVMGGLAFLCSNKVGPGHIHHLDYGLVTLGDYTADHSAAGVTERMKTVGADFEMAGVQIVYEEDLETARWRKLVWNIPFNGLCTVLRQTTQPIMKHTGSRVRARMLMEEVVAAAAACGHVIPSSFVDKMMTDTDRMTDYRPSMLLDAEAGRPMEVEAIFGNPLRAAQAAGQETPAIQALYQELLGLNSSASLS